MSDGVRVYEYVAKHGSHNQRSHAGGRGGAADGGGGGGSSDEQAMNDALAAAKASGASPSEIQSVKQSHETKDASNLEDLETGFAEAHADFTSSSRGRLDVGSRQAKRYEHLHTATVMALRDVTGKGKSEWPTLTEMGGP